MAALGRKGRVAVGGAAAVGTRAAASSGLAGPGRGAAGRLKRRTGVGLAGGLEPAGELPPGELPGGAAAGLGATGGLAVGGEPAGGRLTGGFIVRRAILGRAAVGGRPLSMAEAPGIFGHDGVGRGALFFLELEEFFHRSLGNGAINQNGVLLPNR